ncbi:MAG: hypothetical protein ACK5MQ_05840, partial [Pikeienuella sp.]
MWINSIFAREFGYSDVQSNYSRVYAWMANQLGHMTLGLATALIYAWIVDTVSTAAMLIVDWDGRPTLAAKDCECALGCVANNYLLFLASAAILGAILFILGRGAFIPAGEAPHEIAGRYRAIPPKTRQALHGATLAAALAALLFLLIRAMVADDPASAERLVGLFGVAAASFAIAAGVLMLCRDMRYITFGLIAVFAAFWIATAGAGAAEGPRLWIAVALALLFFLYGLSALVVGRDLPERLGRAERWVQAGTIAAIALWYVFAAWDGLEGDWPLAIAAAGSSCTLWWVKEFASDLPNVHQEIATAVARRPEGVLGHGARVEQDYLEDARMDGRTDGMFYLAGAWTGAGVLSDTPVMTHTSWPAGSEMLGLIIFIL